MSGLGDSPLLRTHLSLRRRRNRLASARFGWRWQVRALSGLMAILAVSILGLAAQPARADANALEKIVLGKCVPDEVEAGKPAPCATVDLAGRYAVLKDLVGASHYLLIPTDKVEGIEDAWQSRTLMDKSLGRPVPRDVVGLAINSVRGRSQNQLHIHIDCVRRGVLDTLVHDSGAIGTTWAPLPDKLAGHAYQAMRIEAADLSGTSPFALLANGQPAVAGDMADETLVAVAESLPDGSEGFYLLADKVDLAQGDFGSGEELLDHNCGVLKEQ